MSALLVGKVGIVESRYGCVIRAAQQHTTKLLARGFDPPREQQRRITKVDEGDLTALLDPPAMTQSRRKAGLSSMGNLRRRYLRSHRLAL